MCCTPSTHSSISAQRQVTVTSSNHAMLIKMSCKGFLRLQRQRKTMDWDGLGEHGALGGGYSDGVGDVGDSLMVLVYLRWL